MPQPDRARLLGGLRSPQRRQAGYRERWATVGGHAGWLYEQQAACPCRNQGTVRALHPVSQGSTQTARWTLKRPTLPMTVGSTGAGTNHCTRRPFGCLAGVLMPPRLLRGVDTSVERHTHWFNSLEGGKRFCRKCVVKFYLGLIGSFANFAAHI